MAAGSESARPPSLLFLFTHFELMATSFSGLKGNTEYEVDITVSLLPLSGLEIDTRLNTSVVFFFLLCCDLKLGKVKRSCTLCLIKQPRHADL
jgi:hypothetical protein